MDPTLAPNGNEEETEAMVQRFKELLGRLAVQNAQFSDEEVAEDVAAVLQSVRSRRAEKVP